jgi:hypothetical protein
MFELRTTRFRCKSVREQPTFWIKSTQGFLLENESVIVHVTSFRSSGAGRPPLELAKQTGGGLFSRAVHGPGLGRRRKGEASGDGSCVPAVPKSQLSSAHFQLTRCALCAALRRLLIFCLQFSCTRKHALTCLKKNTPSHPTVGPPRTGAPVLEMPLPSMSAKQRAPPTCHASPSSSTHQIMRARAIRYAHRWYAHYYPYNLIYSAHKSCEPSLHFFI